MEPVRTRFVVVLPLSPVRDGETFTVQQWPLHITVVPPFEADASPPELTAALVDAAAALEPQRAIAGRDALFGRGRDVPVTLIRITDGLISVHDALTDALRPFAAVPEEPAFTHHGFRPHVTIKGDRRVHEGDVLTLEQIALVDMAPRSEPAGRAVLAVVPLTGRD